MGQWQRMGDEMKAIVIAAIVGLLLCVGIAAAFVTINAINRDMNRCTLDVLIEGECGK